MKLSEWWKHCLVKFIRWLGVPRHVALIMDGNRRFARKQTVALPVIKGHEFGFETFRRLCEVCLELQIQNLTVFAFALPNFNRSEEELTSLLELFERSFKENQWINGFLTKQGVKVLVAGDMTFLRPSLKAAINEVTEATKNCDKMVLTVCVSYGGRNELVRSAAKFFNLPPSTANLGQESLDSSTHGGEKDRRTLNRNSEANAFNSSNSAPDASSLDSSFQDYASSDIEKFNCFPVTNTRLTPAGIRENLDTANLPAPDMLVRTSGETRLSDFLIYQCCEETTFYFVSKLWPEFSVFDFLACVVHYQLFGWVHRSAFLNAYL